MRVLDLLRDLRKLDLLLRFDFGLRSLLDDEEVQSAHGERSECLPATRNWTTSQSIGLKTMRQVASGFPVVVVLSA